MTGENYSHLGWSITAMRQTTVRLLKAAARDRANGFAVISEALCVRIR